jgi:hypothetical protein
MDGKDDKIDTCLDNLIIVLVELVVLVINDETVRTSLQSGVNNNIGTIVSKYRL